MINLGDLFLAVVLLGPQPPWWRPLRRWKWRKGMALIRQASAVYTLQAQAEQRIMASVKRAQQQWGTARVEDGEVN